MTVFNNPKLIIILLLGAFLWIWEGSRRYPAYGDAFYQMARSAEKAGDPDQALAYYEKTVRHDPALSDAHFHKAKIYARRKDPKRFRREIEALKGLGKDDLAKKLLREASPWFPPDGTQR